MKLLHLYALVLTFVSALSVGQARAQDQTGVQPTETGVLVDFQDADIRLVITALAEAGNLNVVYAELPARRVTLHMRQPVARADILPLLKSIAQANGLTLTEDGTLVRIGQANVRKQPSADTTKDAQRKPLRLFVYRLKHARAARLAATLQSIFGGTRAQSQPRGLAPPLSEQLRNQQVTPLGVEKPPTVSVQVSPVTPSLPGQLRGEVLIVPDETTNSLLVRAQLDDWTVVQQAIEAMDLRPLQVLIEVLIAEVRRTHDLDVSIAGTATSSGHSTATGSAQLQGDGTNNFVLKLLRSGNLTVDAALSALSTRGDVRILSRPVILAQNNQEAKILVGSERPFIQVSRSLPTDAAVRDQVIQYRDVGTSLSILPTVSPDGYVNLQLVQQVSTATAETQFGAPVISTREASTHLFVRDGQTAVVGGLIDREKDRTRTGIPLLMDIPLIGGLFGSTHNTTSNSELFLFLTPHIVQTDEDTDRLREGVERNSELLKDALSKEHPIVPPPPDTTHSSLKPKPDGL